MTSLLVFLGLLLILSSFFKKILERFRIKKSWLIILGLVFLVSSAFVSPNSQKAVNDDHSKTVKSEAGSKKGTKEKPTRFKNQQTAASVSSQSSFKSSSSSSSSTSSKNFISDQNHGFSGFQQYPLSFLGKRQLILAPNDGLGRARDAHIQLKNNDEPVKKRDPYLTFDPVGWHNYRFLYRDDNGQIKKAWLMNRGHLVGYQFSGLNDESRNLVPETAWLNAGDFSGMNESNPDSMLYYENRLDNWLALHPDYYLDYQVTPLYSGNELIPRQIRLAYVGVDQAGRHITISLNPSKEHQGNGDSEIVYLDNVSSNAQIDYLTGRAAALLNGNDKQGQAIKSSSSFSSQKNTDRTVFVASHGRSNVYWYNENSMPSSTNKNNVITMTEQQALNQGKYHSKEEAQP